MYPPGRRSLLTPPVGTSQGNEPLSPCCPTRRQSKGYEDRATSGGDQLGPPNQDLLGASDLPIGLEANSRFSFYHAEPMMA